MSSCKDCFMSEDKNCFMSEVCDLNNKIFAGLIGKCKYFKDKSKIVELPCKVGDTVYITGEKYPCEITEVVIDKYGIHFNWLSFERSYELTELWNNGDFTVDDISKTVFLTKEAAEQALREREQ